MVATIRRQVDAVGDPFTAIPFLDDCVTLLIFERQAARQALMQVKVDHINKKISLPESTRALVENALTPTQTPSIIVKVRDLQSLRTKLKDLKRLDPENGIVKAALAVLDEMEQL